MNIENILNRIINTNEINAKQRMVLIYKVFDLFKAGLFNDIATIIKLNNIDNDIPKTENMIRIINNRIVYINPRIFEELSNG